MKKLVLSAVFLAFFIGQALSAHGDRMILRHIALENQITRMIATQEQMDVARQKAQVYMAHLPPAKKEELKKKKIRYLAVPTVRSKSTSPSAKEVVMIWDIPRESFASKSVYESDTVQPGGQLASFDNMQAEYISGGASN